MTYYSKSNYIQYEEWFEKNIDPCELEHEKEKKFIDSIHKKFYKMSKYNLIIGSRESDVVSNKTDRCSGGLCSLTDEEFKQL